MKLQTIASLLLISFTLCNAQVPVEIVSKEIEKIWDEVLTIKSMELPATRMDTSGYTERTGLLAGDEIFALYDGSNGIPEGYCFASSAPGRFENFDYFILYDSSLEVRLVKIYKYRSTHGGAVAGKRWLRQFAGYKDGALRYGKDVQAISGATISGRSMVSEVERAGKVMHTFVSGGVAH